MRDLSWFFFPILLFVLILFERSSWAQHMEIDPLTGRLNEFHHFYEAPRNQPRHFVFENMGSPSVSNLNQIPLWNLGVPETQVRNTESLQSRGQQVRKRMGAARRPF